MDGLDRVELINTLDKKPIREVEGVHFGFAFNLPKAVVRMNSSWAVAEPEKDQIPGACKNWFSIERWVDISGPKHGVTWVTLDAPLVEIGGLTANLPRSQPDPKAYLEHITPSPTLYSWVMNNHWHTNYRADQEGVTTFRYFIGPHKSYNSLAAHRLGIECSQPLIATPAVGAASALAESRLQVRPETILVTAFKPSDDGKAYIVRLFNVGDAAESATISWSRPVPSQLWLSDASEQPLQKISGSIRIPAMDIVTLRAELE